jgi:hypothetical protein
MRFLFWGGIDMGMNGSSVLIFVYDKDHDGEGLFTDKYILVGEQTSLSQEQSVNLVEAGHKTVVNQQYVYGKGEATLSIEALAFTPTDKDQKGLLVLKNSYKNRKKAYVKRAVFDGTSTSDVEYAEVVVESISFEYPDDDVSTVSVELKANGPFTTEPPTIVDSEVSGSVTD